jgi:hypothetical protein
MYFTGKCDGPSIESFIKERKSAWEDNWPHWVDLKLQGDAAIWWKSLDYKEMMTLSNGEFEKILLDKWSHGENKDKERTKSLFSCEKSILQVHGCIHKENIIVSINPSCMHNFINVQLVNRLQVPIKNIQSTNVEGENVQIFKDLKITMDKYVLHSDFYAMDMDEVDIVLGYPWIESVGTININVQKKFLKLWYKKKKITLQDVSLSKKDGPMEASKEVIAQSEVESEAESTEGDEAKLQEGHNQEAKEVIDSKAQSVADLKKKEQIPTVVVYRHPHHIEMQKSSRQGHVHQHIYAPAGHQTGNRSRGAWRTTNTTGRAQATETIPWQPRHDAEKDKGGKVADRHHVRLPLGWMDGRTWYQLATLLSRSYCMVSSHVSRMKHVKGDGM